MALDEGTRHALHLRLDELVGPELAAGMMTAYPPFDWDEVALKSDLLAMEDRLTNRVEASLHREINRAMTSQTRSLVVAVVGAMLANASLTIGTFALLG